MDLCSTEKGIPLCSIAAFRKIRTAVEFVMLPHCTSIDFIMPLYVISNENTIDICSFIRSVPNFKNLLPCCKWKHTEKVKCSGTRKRQCRFQVYRQLKNQFLIHLVHRTLTLVTMYLLIQLVYCFLINLIHTAS